MSLEYPAVSHEGLTNRLSTLTSFIKDYKWIIDSYVSDFFTEELHERLPSCWWNVLSNLKPEELASLLDKNTWKSSIVWPLSLLAFRSVVTQLSLGREPVNITAAGNDKSTDQPPTNPESATSDTSHTKDQDIIQNGQYRLLEHCYRKHVKPKKQHEILQMGQVLEGLTRQCKCGQVVDVGAGQGHLARLLSFGYGIKVTTIEAADCHAPKAQKFDKEVKYDMKKGGAIRRKKKQVAVQSSIADGPLVQPSHVIARIDPTIPVQEFLDTLSLSTDGSPHHHVKQENQPIHYNDSVFRNGLQHEDLNRNEKSTKYSKFAPNRTDLIFNNSDLITDLSRNHDGLGIDLTELRINSKSNQVDADDEMEREVDSVEIPSRNSDEITQEIISEKRNSNNSSSAPDNRFILTGLHACGDLTPTMLRVFLQCPPAVALASVGCCYMKLSTQETKPAKDDRDVESLGYPMSTFVQNLPHHQLSYEAREMACHFIDCYHERLQNNLSSLHSHVYRAALQEVIQDKAPHIKHGCIKLTVKHSQDLTFQRYAEAALRKLDLDVQLSEDQLLRAECRLKDWCHIVAFYTLRLSLAPLVETIILMDRALYLSEHDLSCWLLPIFNPKLSPRNYIVLAKK